MGDILINVITTPMRRIRVVRVETWEVEDIYRMYAGNKTAPVKGTWEHIAGFKFVGLLERSTEMPMALLVLCPLKLRPWLKVTIPLDVATVQAAKLYCACIHASAYKSFTCQEWNSYIATTVWGYSTGSIGPTSKENLCICIASRVAKLQTSGSGTQYQSLQNIGVKLWKHVAILIFSMV